MWRWGAGHTSKSSENENSNDINININIIINNNNNKYRAKGLLLPRDCLPFLKTCVCSRTSLACGLVTPR